MERSETQGDREDHPPAQEKETSGDPVDLVKRTWVYTQRPMVYDIAGCECGNKDPDWSEYRGHLWCRACQKDFIPEHNGVFDGPILVRTCALMGIYFDRFNLETEKVELFDIEGGQ